MPPDDLNGIDDELFPTVVLQQQQQQQEANSSRNLRRNLSEEAKKKQHINLKMRNSIVPLIIL